MTVKNKPLDDYTGQGLLESAYSYEAPAYLVANGIVNGLIKAGWSEKQALNWLHSKNYRWSLDFGLAKALESLGLEVGENAAKEYRPTTFEYDLPEQVQENLSWRNKLVGAA